MSSILIQGIRINITSLLLRETSFIASLQHRYYGKSTPFGSKQQAYQNSETLGYFSSTQALADYAQLIIDLKKNLSAENCPVIAMGGSYGGSKLLIFFHALYCMMYSVLWFKPRIKMLKQKYSPSASSLVSFEIPTRCHWGVGIISPHSLLR